MSGFITSYGEDLLLDLVCRRRVSPEFLYLALLTQPGNRYSSGYDIAEPTVAEYKRVVLGNAPGNWEQRGGEMANADAVSLPFYFTEPWPLIVGWALVDAPEGGQVLWAGDLSPVQPTQGSSLAIPAGGLVIRTMAYASGVGR